MPLHHTAPAQPEGNLDPVALTGRLTAALRARESARPDPLFHDPFAARLAGADGEDLLAVFGEQPSITVRTRFFDEKFAEIAGAGVGGVGGVDQFVILAAGMDSRAYRLDFAAGTDLFELDRAEVLQLKDTLLAQPDNTAVSPRCTRHPVGVDLTEDWWTSLVAAGFNPSRPSCWLAEGLTQYLTEPAVHQLLDHVTALSSAGSHLLIDIVGQSMLDSPAVAPMLREFAERRMPWRYGTDRPEDLLAPRGWRPDVALISTIGTQYGRWPYPDQPRGAAGVPQGYLVHARR